MMRDDKNCCLFLFMRENLLFESNAVEKSFQILAGQVGYFFQGQEEVDQVNRRKLNVKISQ